MSDQDPIVITAAQRTPMGGFQGALGDMTAAQLGSTAIAAAVGNSKLEPADVEEVVMGCVLPAGQGQAPARQAALGAELPLATSCTTINKMCGSGMKAVMFAHDSLLANSNRVMVAGGMESMSNAPCNVTSRRGTTEVTTDEQPHKANLEKIPQLRAAFAKDGSVTAANSSSISDGAAALVMMRKSEAARRGLQPMATILGHSSHAHEPNWFTTAPVYAMKNLHDRLGLTQSEIDLYEVNEAFAVVTMAAMNELELPHDKVNVHGGACALGHPIGASGARILVTLIHALQQRNLQRGMAALCIGGGEATAVAIELNRD